MDTSLDDLKIPTIADMAAEDEEGAPADPLEFLLQVMQGKREASQTQVRAAIAAAQYLHVKKGDAGKKDEKADAAERASHKFNTPRVPLKVVGG